MTDTPRFEVAADPADAAGDTLVVGYAMPGMAGLSATDYLVRQHEFDEIGHLRARGLPAIAPFEAGRPRFPVRLYADPDDGLTVLLCELFVPVPVAEPFADGLLSWAGETDLSEVAILHGIPYPHGPEGHDVFVTATPAYRERRLGEAGIEPLSGGFFDGVAGELVLRALDDDAPPVGVFVTPSHPPGPDLEGAIRLLGGIERVYDVDVDSTELKESAEKQRQYYAELADRMQALRDEGAVGTREYPEDRMFM